FLAGRSTFPRSIRWPSRHNGRHKSGPALPRILSSRRDPYVMSATNGTHVNANRLGGDVQDLEHLRSENEELRALVLELEHALQSSSGGQEDWEARSREYEALLEEKSELIRTLHRKVQALEQELGSKKEEVKEEKRPSGPLPREEELMMLSE